MIRKIGFRLVYRCFFKRVLDIAGAAIGLLALSPLLACLGIAVWWAHGAPIFFRQRRPGLNDELFTMVKFRSMLDGRDAAGQLLSDTERLTRLGRFLRRTSLDELPELWNVLRGDMSLVGPRPLLVEYLPYYTDREKTRHSVRPGITGLAQVSGRNLLSWEERLELDAKYVEQCGIWRDLSILVKTVWLVVSGSGVIIVPGSAQAPLHRCRARPSSDVMKIPS